MERASGLEGIDEEMTLPADFAGNVRSRVFRTQREVAEHIGTSRSTISKYESGIVTPSPSYLAFLVTRLCDQERQLNTTPGAESGVKMDTYERSLLVCLNKLFSRFRGLYPGVRLFRDWPELRKAAEAFEQQHRPHALNGHSAVRGQNEESECLTTPLGLRERQSIYSELEMSAEGQSVYVSLSGTWTLTIQQSPTQVSLRVSSPGCL